MIRFKQRRFWRLAAVVSVSVSAGACGGDSATDPSVSVAGTYNLSTVNGSSPPVTLVSVTSYSLRVTSGNLIISASNTWSNSTTLEETEAGQTTTETLVCSGTYTRNGPSLTLVQAETNDCGGTFLANWDGSNRITVSYDAALSAVYTR